jgi:chromosome segregation ATPase
VVEALSKKLVAAENQCKARDAKIESLGAQLSLLREAREREAAELSMQVTDLEAKLKELLCDREQEVETRASEIEGRLRQKDVEWEQLVTTAVAQVQERDRADQERISNMKQRQGSIHSAIAAWENAKEIACSELELLRCNKHFLEVTLAGLDVSVHQLRK